MFDERGEISHGIHPAIPSEGGLEPALTALRRRSVLPLELDLYVERPRPERVEVAAYYVVSEALSNAAKHAHASIVNVEFGTNDAILQLAIRDDGIGGADPSLGSGLIGLSDCVAALGGTFQITSPAGNGTTLLIEFALESTSGAVSPEPRAGWSPVGEGGSECGESAPDRWVTFSGRRSTGSPKRRASRCPAQRWRG